MWLLGCGVAYSWQKNNGVLVGGLTTYRSMWQLHDIMAADGYTLRCLVATPVGYGMPKNKTAP